MSGAAKAVVGFLVGRPPIAIAIAAVVVGVLLLGTRSQKTPVTHRTQHVELTDAQQMQLGNQQYAKELRADRSRIVSSGPQFVMVNRVARRIEAVASRDKPDFVWKVTLVRKNVANAFCLPGGKIVVYTGILPLTRDDAGLATVLGHEVAHALREHTRERVSRAYAQQLVLQGAAAVTGVGEGTASIANMVADVTFQLPFSRDQESEADTIGLELMARAGYDPHAALTLWNKMASAAGGGGTPKFLSTHPAPKERIHDIEKNLPRALPLYAQAKH